MELSIGPPEIRWTGQRRPAAELCPSQMKLCYEKLL